MPVLGGNSDALGVSQTSSLSCARPNCNKFDCSTTLAQQLIKRRNIWVELINSDNSHIKY